MVGYEGEANLRNQGNDIRISAHFEYLIAHVNIESWLSNSVVQNKNMKITITSDNRKLNLDIILHKDGRRRRKQINLVKKLVYGYFHE